VLGNYLTENDREEVFKSIRKICENIFPQINLKLQIEFIPIRRNPYPEINILG
jgi:hypothetical protein